MSHYIAEIVIPPTDDVKASIEQVMESIELAVAICEELNAISFEKDGQSFVSFSGTEHTLGIELSGDTLYDDMRRVCKAARAYLKSIEPPEPLPPCTFCGRDYDLGRALDKRICAQCWNSGLRLPADMTQLHPTAAIQIGRDV